MKTFIAFAILALSAITSASATDSCYRPVSYCAPYITHTCVVCSHTECRWAVNHCGHRYSYHVRVTTYRSTYNTGATNTFTRTSRI